MQKKMILGRSQLHVKKIHIANMMHLKSENDSTQITSAIEEEAEEEHEAKMNAKKG